MDWETLLRPVPEEWLHRCWHEGYYGMQMIVHPKHPSIRVLSKHDGGHVRVLTDQNKIVAGEMTDNGWFLVDMGDWQSKT